VTVICQALACLFAIVVLSQPGIVHYDYQPAPTTWSSR
jgi:hypothetical protein